MLLFGMFLVLCYCAAAATGSVTQVLHYDIFSVFHTIFSWVCLFDVKFFNRTILSWRWKLRRSFHANATEY